MSHSNSVFSQRLKLISRHEFETLAKTHHKGRVLRTISRWSQFVALSFAQLAGRCSLRDIVSNLDKQRRKSYHLGIAKVSRSSLARVNELTALSILRRIILEATGTMSKLGA